MKKKRLFTYAFSVAALSSLITIPAAAQTDIHVLDVGQGLSVLVESQGHYMLYDGGDRTKSSYVVSYLQGQGISSLDYVIASHYDSDHLNGVVGALNVFPRSSPHQEPIILTPITTPSPYESRTVTPAFS